MNPTQQLITRVEIKSVDTSQREIVGHAAAIGNKDRVGDIIDTGAFDRTLKENDDVLVFIGHDSSRLTVGEPISIRPDTKGLLTTTRVYNTPAGDELLEVAKQRMASGKTLGMSIGYRTVKDRYSGGARHLLDVDLLEYSFLASPVLAANPEATVTGVKRHAELHAGPFVGTTCVCEECLAVYVAHQDEIKARAIPPEELPVPGKPMTAEQKAALPDHAFAFIEDGGTKDDSGLTTPRTKRHFAHHAGDGAVDETLLRDAMADAFRSDVGKKALAHLERHAKATGIVEHTTSDDAHAAEWSEGVAPSLLVAARALYDLAEQQASQTKAMAELSIDTKRGGRASQAVRDGVKGIIATLTNLMSMAEAIEQGEDGKARVDTYRAQLALMELQEVA